MRAYAVAPAVATLPSAAPPLTPDAAAVLSRAAADASRRRHAHTTPLHAAAALLSGPAPLLRDACIAGLASPHPLRCRALDLCFSVALDRLPTSTELQHQHQHHAAAPPLSNALAAALKRAYAHHRRIGSGGVEADDHRVGVPHLVLAILDDPSVARVMREASFSSTAVKAAMLRSLSDPAAPDAGVFVNTRVMHRQASSHREEEVAKVVEVLKRGKKRNPVLVGDTADVDAVVQEVVALVQRHRLGNARVISFPKEFGDLVDMDRAELVAKIKELGEAVRSASNSAGVVVNLGNLQWLVEERCAAPAHQGEQQDRRRDVVLDTARAAVAEVARVLNQSGEGEHRVWVIGTATCATYLKFQVYHPALESEWDLQAVPITPRPPPPPPPPPLGLAPRGILSSSVEVLSTAMTAPLQRAPSLCSACVDGYERERTEMASSERAACPAEQPMSQWLQIGTPSSARQVDRAQEKAREADELRRRWIDRCAQLHTHGRPPLVACSDWTGASILANMQAPPVRQPVQPRVTTVDTDLALGLAAARPACEVDDKLLVRRLTEAVRWQPEAAAAVARTIAKARSGEGKRRGAGSKAADAWVVFAGPDVAGKRSMAEALSKSVFGTGAVTVRLGCGPQAGDDGGESVASCRGRTALDRVAEAVRANPFRVVVLDGVDHHADSVVHGSIVRAIESGRLSDSNGRDVALGSNIFVVISQWSPLPDHQLRSSQEGEPRPYQPWSLESGAGTKRGPEQPIDGDRRTKARKHSAREPLPLDLNLSMSDDHVDAALDDSGGEGSRNSSSDLTVEHEQEYYGQQTASARCSAAPSNISELIKAADGVVVFKPPVELEPLKRSFSDLAPPAKQFVGDIAGGGWSVHHVDDGLLGRLTAAAAGATRTSTPTIMEAWSGELLCPSIRQFKRSLSTNDVDGATVEGSGRRKDGELFPMPVTVDGN
ncbi:hypothetical protein BS78_04G302000 [Paspalum vaginatum]|nr:hypothetical protein BS78_04G302000 [Paspalum vaginatum]